jgi:hypothetical protein
MNPLKRKAFKAVSLALVFACLQFYVVFAFAGPSLSLKTSSLLPIMPQAIMGKLITRGNQPVSVNGNNVTTGATILSGATVETGDGVGATINLGPLGSIDIAPNSKLVIEFSAGQVKVTIIQGCAIVRNKQGISSQVYTEKGLATNNDSNQKQAGVLDVCLPLGAPSPIVNQGAAANAGSGAGAAAGDATGNLPPSAWAGIILGGIGVAALPLALHRGQNPSPGTP